MTRNPRTQHPIDSRSNNIMKTVYVLGAGASIDHSQNTFPDIKGIFGKATALGMFKDGAFGELGKYVSRFAGRDIARQTAKIDAEEIYTMLEIETEIGDEYGAMIKQQFIKLLVTLFTRLESSLAPGHKDSRSYSRFAGMLKPDDTVITFNWELLLDDTLNRDTIIERTEAGDHPNQTMGLHYGNFMCHLTGYSDRLEVSEFPRIPVQSGHPFPDTGKGYLLKLHGSIDWRICVNGGCRNHGLIFPVRSPLAEYSCPECQEVLETLIIPPALSKPIRKTPSIRRLWNYAADAVRNAERIVVWGYGLPPTDFYAKWLLRQSRNLKSLVVINPETTSTNKNKTQTFRNRRFLGKFTDIFGLEPVGYTSLDQYLGRRS